MKALAFGLLSLALAGCGGSDGDFTGKWTCTTTFTTPNLPPFVETDPWTGVDLGNGIITISDDDVHSCPAVKLKVDGDNASLVAGQSCAVSDGTQVTYLAWNVKVDGDTMTMDYHDSTQFGSDAEESTCTRQ